MHPTPAQLLQNLHDDLTPFVRQQKGQLSVAGDPYHFLELMGEAPVGWRCVVHWAGDENQSQEGPAAFLRNEFHVGLTCNLGLTPKPGEAVMKTRPNHGPSLLELVQLTRARVRSFSFGDGTTGQPTYLGCDPVVLPDGMPLAAYRLRFSLISSDEPVTFRE